MCFIALFLPQFPVFINCRGGLFPGNGSSFVVEEEKLEVKTDRFQTCPYIAVSHFGHWNLEIGICL
jgi:hypothetical protein